MEYPAGMVRAVAPIKSTPTARGFRYVSVIRFANCYSVVLSNDPTGYAGGWANRLNVTQTNHLGHACAVLNSLAARCEAVTA